MNTQDIIIRCALEAKYPGINFNDLIDVMNATPNAQIAAVKLLGAYQRPTLLIERTSHPEYNNRFGTFTLTGYNEFTERVSFKGKYISIERRYFTTEEEAYAATNAEVLPIDSDLPGQYKNSSEYVFEGKVKRWTDCNTWCTVEEWNTPEE